MASTPSLTPSRTPSRSMTPASQGQMDQPIFPPLLMDRAGCPSGIQFRPERRAQEFIHPFLAKPVYRSVPMDDETGYTGYIKRRTDPQLFARSYAKGSWEAARLGMPRTLMLSRSVPSLLFTRSLASQRLSSVR
ncbi:unnamed protein product [Durusdinium trenchii]|uniref:Uncharacterized protein n=1 Tax=Durusdinium trenchii TaxID=1381693 RepID=A0ABP0PIQ4_9DINO